jgi:hypothetical protein
MYSRNNLAFTYIMSGRRDEAVPLFEAVLVGRERVLGHSHPDTLKSRSNLASASMEGGRMGEAMPLLKSVLAERERLFGGGAPRHAGVAE